MKEKKTFYENIFRKSFENNVKMMILFEKKLVNEKHCDRIVNVSFW